MTWGSSTRRCCRCTPGLTVLTGETGAGKTMVVTGLGLLLGGRGDSGLVRAGADRVVVEGVVDLPAGHPALARAAEAGADVSDGLVLVRSVSADGRSRAHVGGRAAPVGVLAELAEHLVAVHGQADQWRLRRADQHREVLDAFGGPERRRRRSRPTVRCTPSSPPPRPSWPTCAPRPPSGPARPRRCASASSASRPSTRSPARTTRSASRAERLGHAEELRAGAGAAHTRSWPATTTPGCRRRGVARGARHGVGPPRRRQRQRPGAGRDRHPGRRAALPRRRRRRRPRLLPRRRRRRPRPPRAGRAAPRRPRRAHPALRPDRRRRARAGAREAARRVAELDGTGDRIGELEERVVHAHRRDARRPPPGSPRRAPPPRPRLGARITDELSHLAMGSATRDGGRRGLPGGSPPTAATTSRSGSRPAPAPRRGR